MVLRATALLCTHPFTNHLAVSSQKRTQRGETTALASSHSAQLTNWLGCRYWMSVGAQPSDKVAHLLGQIGVLPSPPSRGPTQSPPVK